MPHPSDLDQQTIAKQFKRRAWHAAAQQHFLAAEIESRMFERLEVVKITPKRVLDIGCGFGRGTERLCKRFPEAQVIGLDLVADRLPQHADKSPGGWRRWLMGQTAPPAVQWEVGDAHSLRHPDHSVDLIWSNLAWTWLADPPAAVAEWYRALAPGGLLMLSGFGVDTMQQWRELARELELSPAPEFADMHDVGDLLVTKGLVDPVMDTEVLTVTYKNAADLIAEVRQMGGDARRSRKSGLATPRQYQRWLQALESRRNTENLIELKIEVVNALAWVTPDKLAQIEKRRLKALGMSPVEFRRG